MALVLAVCRVIATKEPRVLSLDMDSTVPRKMGDLARAFSVHAEADGAEIAAMMAQVRYCVNPSPPSTHPPTHPPTVLRYDG